MNIEERYGLGIRISKVTIICNIALFGVLFKIFTRKKFEKNKIFSLILYIAMGWLMVIAIKPMTAMVSPGFLAWLFAGGIIYTLGTIFYSIKKIPYNHAIWHFFVLAGSVTHFFGIFLYLT